MTHTYKLTGMTCNSCEAKVQSALQMLENVTNLVVSKDNNSVKISMDKHIALEKLQQALDPKYQILAINHNEIKEQTKSWFESYKPIILIFFYISMVTTIMAAQLLQTDVSNLSQIAMKWMSHFMGGFFMVFSFFKLLDIKGFADSYQMYDIIAQRLPAWGYIYVFIELGLGIAFLSNYNPILTNSITVIVMSISIIGVLQSVINKKKIQCACLGAIFNLPMSTVTIIEVALMIAISGIMLFMMN